VAPGIINAIHIAQKVKALLEMYPRPDRRRWSGQEIDEATGGVVRRSYVTNLRKGSIENPRYEKMRAIADALVSKHPVAQAPLPCGAERGQ
jgi:hypothetical protein